MERTFIIDTLGKTNEKVTVNGWIERIRTHGKITFFDLRDSSGLLQVVVVESDQPDAFSQSEKLAPETVVRVEGVIHQRGERYINKNLPTGSIELSAQSIEIITNPLSLPFDTGKDDLNLELPTLLDHRILSLRNRKLAAIFKIQETIVASFRKTLKDKRFTEIFAPTIIRNAPEGGAEVFEVDYYGKKAFLAQSPQLYKQMMVSVFERVFTVAHAYRAEPSVTTRHLSEYVSLDAEMGFINSFNDIMDVVEEIVKNYMRDVQKQNKHELEMYNVKLPLFSKPIPRIKMRDAQEITFKRGLPDHRQEPDLDPADEKEICKWAEEQTGTPFVFITHYPTKKRPFYTMPDPKDPEYTLSFDLLGFTEEWVTGGQRIHDYEMLVDHINTWGNSVENFEMYLQAFKYGMPPEGGFAMGLERITKDILGLANVREASLFPRDMDRIDERLTVTKE